MEGIAPFLPPHQTGSLGWMTKHWRQGLESLGEAVLTHKQMGGCHDSIFLRMRAGVISSGKVYRIITCVCLSQRGSCCRGQRSGQFWATKHAGLLCETVSMSVSSSSLICSFFYGKKNVYFFSKPSMMLLVPQSPWAMNEWIVSLKAISRKQWEHYWRLFISI